MTDDARAPCRGALIDLEGTVFSKGRAIPGAAAAIGRLRDAGLHLRFLTNTDSTTAASLSSRLLEMGLAIPPAEIFTAACAAREFLRTRAGSRCHCLLSRELRDEFGDLVAGEGERADYVVVGDCRDTLNYPRLDEAFRHLMNGAELVAMQRGRYFLRDDGCHLDTGGIVAMLEYASGKTAQVLGKPSAAFFLAGLAHAGLQPHEAVVVGDDVETDIRGARSAGIRCILVQTGKYSAEALERSGVLADHTIGSVAELPKLLLGRAQANPG